MDCVAVDQRDAGLCSSHGHRAPPQASSQAARIADGSAAAAAAASRSRSSRFLSRTCGTRMKTTTVSAPVSIPSRRRRPRLAVASPRALTPGVVGDEQARAAAAEDEAQPQAGAALPAGRGDPRAAGRTGPGLGRRDREPEAVLRADQHAAVEGVGDLRGAAEHQRRRGDRLPRPRDSGWRGSRSPAAGRGRRRSPARARPPSAPRRCG